MKRSFLPLLAAAVIISAASCSKSSGPSTPQAQVMFLNGWLGNSGVNITANNATVNTNVQFLSNTSYQNVTASTPEDIAFLLPSNSNRIIDSTLTLTANTHYSIYITGDITTPKEVVTSDDLTAPASGMAKVRFVNLSPDTTGYNVYVGTSTVANTDVKYGGVTGFASISAVSSASVLVQNPYTAPLLIQLSNQSFSAGKIYTVVLTGSSTGTGTAVLKLTILNNN